MNTWYGNRALHTRVRCPTLRVARPAKEALARGLRTARIVLLLPFVLWPVFSPADEDPISEDSMNLVLADVRADFLKQHQAPDKLVDWECHVPQWGKDEAGNTTFTMDIIGAVAGEGQDEGVLYMTRINAFVDPETGEATYTLSNLKGGEGYDAFD